MQNTQSDYFMLDIPVTNANSFQVELMQVNILSDDFQVVTQNGEVIYTDNFPGTFYRGIVKGDQNSVVAISIIEGKVRGLIADNHGNYKLEKLDDLSDSYICTMTGK